MRHLIAVIGILLAILPLSGNRTAGRTLLQSGRPPLIIENVADSTVHDSVLDPFFIFNGDTLFSMFIPPLEIIRSGPLTDADFCEIADSLQVEPAAIKAVVQIEAGNGRAGFYEKGRPLINYDVGLFRRMASRRGVNIVQARAAHPEAFAPLNIPRYGSYQRAQQARLDAAMAIDSIAAIEATFWGMFQVGGFNWKLSGASSHEDFVRRVSRSEYDQLILFANFIRNTGIVKHLRNKNWSGFAKLYNGPGYAARGYHTRMASAYLRYKGSL